MKHKDIVESKIEILEHLLKNLVEKVEVLLSESNGLSDNEWKTEDGTYYPEWPVPSFPKALRDLDHAYTAAIEYFDPVDTELRKKWSEACQTASFIVERFKEDLTKDAKYPTLILSGMQRNIADAIYGNLKSIEGQPPPMTMDDQLQKLVDNGELVNLTEILLKKKAKKEENDGTDKG